MITSDALSNAIIAEIHAFVIPFDQTPNTAIIRDCTYQFVDAVRAQDTDDYGTKERKDDSAVLVRERHAQNAGAETAFD